MVIVSPTANTGVGGNISASLMLHWRHIYPIAAWTARERLSFTRVGTGADERADIVLVDRVGVLGELYALADVAFVGGGFHAAGLHSVLEPAAFGVPVLFGPRHESSRDAALLLECGGGFATKSAAELAERITVLFGDTSARRAAGAAASSLVQSGLGAADRSTALVERLLSTS